MARRPTGRSPRSGERLISIHSQHEHQALLKKEAHRQLLDNFADARDLAGTVRENWRSWQKARRAHDDALNQAREQNEREELLRFQLEELDALALQEGELQELEQEQQRLANAEGLIRICQQSLGALYEGDDGTCNDHLSQVSHWLTTPAVRMMPGPWPMRWNPPACKSKPRPMTCATTWKNLIWIRSALAR